MQHGRLVRRCQFVILQHFVDFVFAKFVIDFVREVTGINKRLVADAFHGVTDIGFVSFTADENAPFVDLPGDIVADLFLRTKIEETLARIVLNVGFPRAVEAFQADQQPGDAAFHEAELGIGEFLTSSPMPSSASWKAASPGCWSAWNASTALGKPTFNTIRASVSSIFVRRKRSATISPGRSTKGAFSSAVKETNPISVTP